GAALGELVVREKAAAREIGDEQAATFAGRGHEGGDEFTALRPAEVDRNRLLALLQAFPVEARAAIGDAGPAIEVGPAANGIEADDFRPHLGEVEGARRGGDEGRAFDDAHALEEWIHRSPVAGLGAMRNRRYRGLSDKGIVGPI